MDAQQNPLWRQRIASIVLHEQPLNIGLFLFDKLVTEWIPEMINQYGTTFTQYDTQKCSIRFFNPRCISIPQTPHETFLENKNYMMDIYVDAEMTIQEEIKHDEEEEMMGHVEEKKDIHRNHLLCSFPVCMHSIMCEFRDGFVHHDFDAFMGSVFICGGKPRIIPFTQRLRYNRNYVLYHPKHKHNFVEVRSEHFDRKHRSTSTLTLFLKAGKGGGQLKKIVQGHQLFCQIPFLGPPVPLSVLIPALGWTNNDFLTVLHTAAGEFWDDNDFDIVITRFRMSMELCKTQLEAWTIISSMYKKEANEKQFMSLQNTLRSEILPHLNVEDKDESNAVKGFFLAHLVVDLLRTALGKKKITDRDAYSYMCVEDLATLTAWLFRDNFKKHMSFAATTMRNMLISKRPLDLQKIFNQSRLTQRFRSSVATGYWSDTRNAVSHPLNAANIFAITSQKRIVCSSCLGTKGKHPGPRMVGPIPGYICAVETQEGERCGLVLTAASLAVISDGSDPFLLMELLREYVTIVPLARDSKNNCKFIGPTGNWLGWVDDGEAVVGLIRTLRRQLTLSPHVSVWLENGGTEVHVDCSRGRFLEPLIVLENLKRLEGMDLSAGLPRREQLLMHGVIEYIDAAERSSDDFATRVCPVYHIADAKAHHTHLIIMDSDLVGICANMIPFLQHNQGPRLVYEVGMMKQAIQQDIYCDYGALTKFLLDHGQRPLVYTRTAREVGFHNFADGVNVVAAIGIKPENQEDALVTNQAAVDRGLWRSSCIRTYHLDRGSKEPQTVFCKPEPGTLGMHDASYENLQEDGLPAEGMQIQGGDVLIGKAVENTCIPKNNRVNMPRELRNEKYQERKRDVSKKARITEKPSSVFEVMVADSIRKVRIRTKMEIEVADKITSRHGQKGTIGAILPTEDMPFVAFGPSAGMIPDLLISPESLVSRMTCGVLLEMMIGKACAVAAMDAFVDEQFFTRASAQQKREFFMDILAKHGFARGGTEIMMNGRTGELIQTPIMMGVIYYSALTHKVSKKIHARSEGPIQPLTRQPREGRRRGGGFRLGCMELDCLAAHGVACLIRERMTDLSDPFEIFVCAKCGTVAEVNMANTIPPFCQMCQIGEDIHKVAISYSAWIMFSELMATGISIVFGLTPNDELVW